MSKILNLRTWLDLYDVAKLLSDAFGEPVNNIDIHRLALDGHLTISIRLINGGYGRACREVKPEEIEWHQMPSLDGKGVINVPASGHTLTLESGLYHVDGPIVDLPDIVDLPMLGGEIVDVEFEFHQLQLQPTPTAVSLEGVLVRSIAGTLFEVQDRFDKPSSKIFRDSSNFHSGGALPEDKIFVVRRECLDKFINEHSAIPNQQEKPVGARERTTLLNIIGALLSLHVTKDAAAIDEILQKFPAVQGLKKRTLEEKFADARRSLKSN